MATPITFPATTPVFNLPLLFAGQAQKEFTLNQALSLIDGFVAGVVVDSLGAPPAMAVDGECYRVTSPASGDWAGHEESIALRVGGAWQFIHPFHGLRIFDQAFGAYLLFDSQWQAASAPDPVAGGATIDVEARAALAQVVDALRTMGVLPHQG